MINRKLILMNGEKKILVFIRKKYIDFPSLSPVSTNKDVALRRYILGAKGFDEDWHFVEEVKKKQVCFYAENNHLFSYDKIIENAYYMKQEDLSGEQIRGIMKYCNRNAILPDFFKIGELLQIVRDKDLNISYQDELPVVLKKLKMNEKSRTR